MATPTLIDMAQEKFEEDKKNKPFTEVLSDDEDYTPEIEADNEFNSYSFEEMTGKLKKQTENQSKADEKEPEKKEPEKEEVKTEDKKVESNELQAKYDALLKEMDEQKSRLTFYDEQRKLMEDDPEGFIREYYPSFFEKQINPQEILDKEFGKDFIENEYDPKEAARLGTRSAEYDMRKAELLQQLKSQKGGEGKNIISVKEKVYAEGIPYLNQVIGDIKTKFGIAEDVIEARIKKLDQELGLGKNPIKAVAYGLYKEFESENIISKEQKRLSAENTLLKSKRDEVPPAPSNETGKLTTTHKKVETDEWDDVLDARFGGHNF